MTKDIKEKEGNNSDRVDSKPTLESEAKVTLKYSCKTSLDETGKEDITLSFALPMKTIDESKKLLSENEGNDITSSDKMKEWLKVFEESINKYIGGNSFKESLKRKSSDWKQEMECGDSNLRITAMVGGSKGDEVSVTTDNALLMINRALNVSTIVKVPLWHTGIWVSIKAPSASTLMAVDRILSNEKIVLGRQTNGMVFSNSSVYIRKTLVDLIIECIINTSVEDIKKSELKKLISLKDYPTLVWGLVCANHPDGYRLAQPCISKVGSCNYISEETVMLSKLSWVDNNALTSTQKRIMAEQTRTKIKEEEVLKYQEDFSSRKEIEVNDSISIILEPPSLEEDFIVGSKWVDSIVSKVDEMFSKERLTEELTNTRILEQSKATALRQYSSWVKTIIIKNSNSDNTVIEDRNVIDSSCDSFTLDEKICKRIFKEIGKFIDETTISLIGIPSYNCPKCEKPQTDESMAHPEIIPLSMDDIFFTLTRLLTNRLIVQNNTF